MDRAARILTSTGFLAGPALLLTNDFVLKQAYPGLLTGKVSDFAGLFIFPMFWAALWPRRVREIYLATALAFVWWKSPWSQPAIDGWNGMFGYHVGRVVDVTDLVALVVLPASLGYVWRLAARPATGFPTRAVPVVILASVLSGAGSLCAVESNISYNLATNDASAIYAFAFPPDELAGRLDASRLFHATPLGIFDGTDRKYQVGGVFGVAYDISLDNNCRDSVVDVTPLFNGTSVRLVRLTAANRCKSGSSEADLREMFESEVVGRLNGDVTVPRQATEPTGERFDYPADAAPTLELSGSRPTCPASWPRIPSLAMNFTMASTSSAVSPATAVSGWRSSPIMRTCSSSASGLRSPASKAQRRNAWQICFEGSSRLDRVPIRLRRPFRHRLQVRCARNRSVSAGSAGAAGCVPQWTMRGSSLFAILGGSPIDSIDTNEERRE
jgi:hypothetical protein